MKNLLPVASVSAALLAAAMPAHAVTFATEGGATVTWTRGNTGPSSGTLTAVNTPNTFNFQLGGMPTGLAASLNMTLTETGVNVQTTSLGGTSIYLQDGLSGSFTETYTGPTTTINSYVLTNGMTLLSGTLVAGSGQILASSTPTAQPADLSATIGSYTSPFIPSLGGAQSVDFTIRLGSGNWGVTTRSYNSTTVSTLNSFSGATASGNFQSSGVTEPAGWALMLSGVGLTGGVLRRRRQESLAV